MYGFGDEMGGKSNEIRGGAVETGRIDFLMSLREMIVSWMLVKPGGFQY